MSQFLFSFTASLYVFCCSFVITVYEVSDHKGSYLIPNFTRSIAQALHEYFVAFMYKLGFLCYYFPAQ